MKNLLKLILSVTLGSLLWAGCERNANAQDNSQIKSSFITFAQNASSNHSASIALYPSYAPDIVVNGKPDTFGFGLAVLTDATVVPALSDSAIAQHAFGGLRFDFLAHEAFASTVALGMKGSVQVYGHNIDLFAQTGANIPFSGFGLKNGEIGAMVGAGSYTTLAKIGKSGSLGLFISAEKWTQFQGYVLHGGPVLSITF